MQFPKEPEILEKDSTQNNKYNLSEISNDEVTYYEIINKYIVDAVVTQDLPDQKKEYENQKIYTLKIPQYRHRTLDFLLNKIFHRKYTKRKAFENTFFNHKYQLLDGILNITVKNNVSKDTTILYYTTANELLELQNLGLTSSQALTSQVIEAVGEYNLIVEQRRINSSNIVTNKTHLKKYIVSEVQYHSRLLQPIERLICNYQAISVETYHQRVRNELNQYITQLEAIENFLSRLIKFHPIDSIPSELELGLQQYLRIDKNSLKDFLSYNDYFLITMHKKLKDALDEAKSLHANINNFSTSKSLSDKLQGYLRESLNAVARNAQAQNDQITSNSDDSLFRGELRRCIMNADKVVNYYVYDQINPITHHHQMDFRTDPNGDYSCRSTDFGQNKVLYQSNKHLGHSKRDLERVLIGITAREDAKKLSELDKLVKPPKIIKSAGWNNFSIKAKDQKLKRFAAWLLTTLTHLPLGLFNIIVTAVTGQAFLANWMQKIEEIIVKKFNIKNNYTHDFFKFKDKLGVNNVYTSTTIGKMLNKVVREFTSVLVQSPKLIFKTLVKQFKLLKNDFATGLWGKLYKNYKKRNEKETEKTDEQGTQNGQLTTEQLSRLQELITQAKINNKIDKTIFKHVMYANPLRPLEPWLPHDIVSSFTGGIEGFFKLFKDNIFENHPGTAVTASLAYFLGGFAVLAPVTFKALLAYIGFSANQAIQITNIIHSSGSALAKGTTGQAIAAGFTLAKMFGATINTATTGFDSALFKMINEFRKDPIIYGVGLGIAYAFGYTITDAINIPGISSYLRDDIGDAPVLCKIMIGAKLGLVSLETALPENEEQKSILAHFLSDVVKNLVIGFRMALSTITLSPRPWIDFGKQCLKGTTIIFNSFNRLAVLAGQMLIQIPKTLLEFATTCYINTAKVLKFLASPFRTQKDHSIPTAGFVLRGKDYLLNKGYKIGFFIRENIPRRLERAYGKKMMELEKQDEISQQQQTQVQILRALQVLENNSYVESPTVVVDVPSQETSSQPVQTIPKYRPTMATDYEDEIFAVSRRLARAMSV